MIRRLVSGPLDSASLSAPSVTPQADAASAREATAAPARTRRPVRVRVFR